jgi:hypothetical protein
MDPKEILTNVGESVTSFFRKNRSENHGPPQLTSPVRFPYGPFQFAFRVTKGESYEIQVSSNLDAWQTISSGTSGTESIDYVDSDASRFTYRFYRVLAAGALSANAVGYVSINAPPGYSMIANPLRTPLNGVSALLPNMNDGTALYKFDSRLFKLAENLVKSSRWSNPDETLSPGEGALFFNPTSDFKTINFCGEVLQGNLLMPLGSGFSMRSSQIPKAGRLHTDLACPVSEGDVVHLFDRDRQKYVIFEYNEKSWQSNPPVVAVGEAFWIGKTKAENWIQSFALSLGS